MQHSITAIFGVVLISLLGGCNTFDDLEASHPFDAEADDAGMDGAVTCEPRDGCECNDSGELICPSSNGTTNNAANVNDQNSTVTEEIVVLIRDQSSTAEACVVEDAGSDIYAVRLTRDGELADFDVVLWEPGEGPATEHHELDVVLSDQSRGLECPDDFAAETVLSLGCGGALGIAFSTVGFLEADDAIVEIGIGEYGAQCDGGTDLDRYSVSICPREEIVEDRCARLAEGVGGVYIEEFSSRELTEL